MSITYSQQWPILTYTQHLLPYYSDRVFQTLGPLSAVLSASVQVDGWRRKKCRLCFETYYYISVSNSRVNGSLQKKGMI